MASRSGKPMENMVVGEELATCHHCGSRTIIIEVFLDGSRHEDCVSCGQSYMVTDEIEEVDEKDEYDSRPTIGELLRERLKNVESDKDKRLKQLGIRSEYGDKFGSF